MRLLTRTAVVFGIYLDSFVFVFATAILQYGVGVNSSAQICDSAILLCLVFYVTTKVGCSSSQESEGVNFTDYVP